MIKYTIVIVIGLVQEKFKWFFVYKACYYQPLPTPEGVKESEYI